MYTPAMFDSFVFSQALQQALSQGLRRPVIQAGSSKSRSSAYHSILRFQPCFRQPSPLPMLQLGASSTVGQTLVGASNGVSAGAAQGNRGFDVVEPATNGGSHYRPSQAAHAAAGHSNQGQGSRYPHPPLAHVQSQTSQPHSFWNGAGSQPNARNHPRIEQPNPYNSRGPQTSAYDQSLQAASQGPGIPKASGQPHSKYPRTASNMDQCNSSSHAVRQAAAQQPCQNTRMNSQDQRQQLQPPMQPPQRQAPAWNPQVPQHPRVPQQSQRHTPCDTFAMAPQHQHHSAATPQALPAHCNAVSIHHQPAVSMNTSPGSHGLVDMRWSPDSNHSSASAHAVPQVFSHSAAAGIGVSPNSSGSSSNGACTNEALLLGHPSGSRMKASNLPQGAVCATPYGAAVPMQRGVAYQQCIGLPGAPSYRNSDGSAIPMEQEPWNKPPYL